MTFSLLNRFCVGYTSLITDIRINAFVKTYFVDENTKNCIFITTFVCPDNARRNFMIKKLLPISAVAALALTACFSDESSPVAPTNPNSVTSQEFSSSSAVVSSSSANIVLSSSDNGSLHSFTQNECTVKKQSDNVVVMDFTVANSEKTTMKMTLVGADVEMDLTTTYDISVPDAEIAQMCEESKVGSETMNASVVCEGRSISVKYKDSANGHTVEDVIESANELCMLMDKYKTPSSSSTVLSSSSITPLSSSSFEIPVSTKQKPNDATCKIEVDTENDFAITIVKPDSIILHISASHHNDILNIAEFMQFDESVPKSVITELCEEAKKEEEEDPTGAIITCTDNAVTETVTVGTDMNALPVFTATLVTICDQIEETGIYMEDL